MIFNDNTFYQNNWADFVHKGAFDEFLKKVAAVEVPDLNIDKIDKVTFQRDDNGEYRLLLSYLDAIHKPQATVLQPAITDRVVQLANQEIVKHFLFNRRGEDVSINTMRFIHDQLELTLIDGEKISLDLKPLVPRIHVEGPDGEVLQKELNYHIDGNKIVFVDLQNHETVLDFTKLLTVDAFNEFKTALETRLKQLETNKLDAQDFTDWLATSYEPAMKKKVNVDDFTAYQSQVTQAIDAKVDKTTYQQNRTDDAAHLTAELDKKVDKTSYNADRQNDAANLTAEMAKKVDQKIYDANREADKQETSTTLATKVDQSSYAHDREADSAALSASLAKKADVTRLQEYQTHAEAAAEQTRVNETFVTNASFNQSQADQDTKIDSKANASDVAADLKKHYTKEEVDAIVAALATKEELTSKANASDVAADLKKHYTKEEVDAIVATLATKDEVEAIKQDRKLVYMPYVASDGNWHVKLVEVDPTTEKPIA